MWIILVPPTQLRTGSRQTGEHEAASHSVAAPWFGSCKAKVAVSGYIIEAFAKVVIDAAEYLTGSKERSHDGNR